MLNRSDCASHREAATAELRASQFAEIRCGGQLFRVPVKAVIPLPLKIVYTLFVCALVPIYWRQYGLANFLWFSDIALLALVPALWLENALLVSMMAVSVVFFEALWNADFFFQLSTGRSLIGLSAYMFDPKIPLVHPRAVMFPHRPAVAASLDTSPTRL